MVPKVPVTLVIRLAIYTRQPATHNKRMRDKPKNRSDASQLAILAGMGDGELFECTSGVIRKLEVVLQHADALAF